MPLEVTETTIEDESFLKDSEPLEGAKNKGLTDNTEVTGGNTQEQGTGVSNELTDDNTQKQGETVNTEITPVSSKNTEDAIAPQNSGERENANSDVTIGNTQKQGETVSSEVTTVSSEDELPDVSTEATDGNTQEQEETANTEVTTASSKDFSAIAPKEEEKASGEKAEGSAIASTDWLNQEEMVVHLQSIGVKIEKIKPLSDAASRSKQKTQEGYDEFSYRGLKLHRYKESPKKSQYRIVG